MKTASCKAKGRRLQQEVRTVLLAIGAKYGLEPGDIESRGMGQNGTDVILSPAAERVFGKLAIECKNRETLNVTSTYFQHAAKYPHSRSVLIHKRNKTDILCTIPFDEYFRLLAMEVKTNAT